MNQAENINNLQYVVEIITGIDELFKKKRDREITDARCLFYQYAYEYFGMTITQLARLTKFNHATVIHSLKKFKDLYIFDKNFKSKWDELVNSNVLHNNLLNKFNRYKELDRLIALFPNSEHNINKFFKEIEEVVLSKYPHIANTNAN